jgi:hypothetical protein
VAAAQEPVGRAPPVAARALGAALLLVAVPAANADALKNWFNDPYFQVRSAVAACRAPQGPFTTEADMRKASHARVERGTSCWLAGECARPNAYMYDAAIADAARARFEGSAVLRNASLWVTVQRRIIWVEGCAPAADAPKQAERLLRAIPDVQQVIVNIAPDPARRPPYPTMEAPGG